MLPRDARNGTRAACSRAHHLSGSTRATRSLHFSCRPPLIVLQQPAQTGTEDDSVGLRRIVFDLGPLGGTFVDPN
jgi:hypothetical protein